MDNSCPLELFLSRVDCIAADYADLSLSRFPDRDVRTLLETAYPHRMVALNAPLLKSGGQLGVSVGLCGEWYRATYAWAGASEQRYLPQSTAPLAPCSWTVRVEPATQADFEARMQALFADVASAERTVVGGSFGIDDAYRMSGRTTPEELEEVFRSGGAPEEQARAMVSQLLSGARVQYSVPADMALAHIDPWELARHPEGHVAPR